MIPPKFLHKKSDRLYLENVSLENIVKKVGTPAYVYSANHILDRYRQFDQAFFKYRHLICFAMKANGNLAISRLLAQEGAGADIVSVGELFRARKARIPMNRIVFSGVGKTEQELSAALQARILMFNVESEDELSLLERVAKRLRRPAPISLRVNPDIHVDTHHHITTGRAENKFGISRRRVIPLYLKAARSPWLIPVGIQAHIGSQLMSVRPYVAALRVLFDCWDSLASRGIHLKYLDLGGGIGVRYKDEVTPHPKDLAHALSPLLRGRDLTLVFEPGRYLVGEGGLLLMRVIYRKSTSHKNFLIVDAAMNDLARPSLYDAYHSIVPIRNGHYPRRTVDIVGPVCESGDYMARRRLFPWVRQGDVLAVLTAGAYGFSMSSNYNARPRAAEVLVRGRTFSVVRKRESLQDLIRGEKIS